MRTTILTLSLLVCLGVVVNSYPGGDESARQQQGEADMNVLVQILEAELQSEEALEEGAMQEETLETGELQEEDATVEGKWYCKGKLMKYLFKSCRKSKKPKLSANSKICSIFAVDPGRKSYAPDASCDGGSCLSCDAICAASREGGLMWRCETGYFRTRKWNIVNYLKKVPCSKSTKNNTFCCCSEYNDLLLRF